MTEPASALQEEANERLAEARKQKHKVDQDLREGLFFAAPNRCRDVSSRSQGEHHPLHDIGELNTSLGMELSGDFVTQLVNTFFPQGERWAMRKASSAVPDAARKNVEDQAELGDKIVFDAIGESNFYPEVGKGFNPDAALGTVAMWVDQPSPSQPLRFQAVPIRELEVNVGPYGEIDDRFVVRHTRARFVEAILPKVDLGKVSDRLKDPKKHVCISRGFWRVYHDDGSIEWRYVAMVDEIVVDEKTLKGPGCCPLIVARFNPHPEYAWGDGPLIQGLPDLRMCDELAQKRIRMIDLTIEPPVGGPDYAIANMEEGLETGMLYPIRAGDKFERIYDPPPQDPAVYFINDQEQRLKRIFFLDYPDQPGKTPPTATQWLDEMTMAQRRFGTPGLPFWWEFCAATFERAQYLLEKAGTLPKITGADGSAVGSAATRLRPYNPAEKAIEQQKVAQFSRFMQIIGAMFPEETKIIGDAETIINNLSEAMGVDDMWKTLTPAQQQAKIKQIQALQAGTPPTAPQVPDGQPSPQPSPVADAINPQESLRSQAA